MDAQLRQWLQESVTWEQFVGNDTYGQPTYAAGVVLACFVDGGDRVIRNAAGDTIIAKASIMFDATTQTEGFTVEDYFTLPGGAKYRPLTVNTLYDEKGRVWSVEVLV